MNARRRPRLFLDHKPPLVAFTVVAVACALMMVHMARSEAAPGWLRAGLGGVIGQRVIEATVLEHDPAPAPATVAAGPLPVGAAAGSSAPLAAAPSDPAPAEHSPSAPGQQGTAVGAVVGEVVRGGDDASDPVEGTNESVEEDDSAGHGHGHGQGRGEGPTPNVTTPDTAPAPQARDHQDWRSDWVGAHGHAKGHAKGHGKGHDHGHHGDLGDHGQGHGKGHGHGDQHGDGHAHQHGHR